MLEGACSVPDIYVPLALRLLKSVVDTTEPCAEAYGSCLSTWPLLLGGADQLFPSDLVPCGDILPACNPTQGFALWKQSSPLRSRTHSRRISRLYPRFFWRCQKDISGDARPYYRYY